MKRPMATRNTDKDAMSYAAQLSAAGVVALIIMLWIAAGYV
jgi:hypothetical protein